MGRPVPRTSTPTLNEGKPAFEWRPALYPRPGLCRAAPIHSRPADLICDGPAKRALHIRRALEIHRVPSGRAGPALIVFEPCPNRGPGLTERFG